MFPPSGSGTPNPALRPTNRAKWAASCGAAFCVACCALLLPCALEVRDDEGWVRSAASLGHIGRALRHYHDVYGRLPPAVVTGEDGRPLYSWRVALLPFLEQDALYKQLDLNERWDGPRNGPLLAETPRCYLPALGGTDGPGLTRYQVFVGPGTAFGRDGLTWDDFADPASTVLVAEAGVPVPWAEPADMAYAPAQPLPPLGGVYTRPVRFLRYEVKREAGFNACFADGTTRFVAGTTGERAIRALIAGERGSP